MLTWIDDTPGKGGTLDSRLARLMDALRSMAREARGLARALDAHESPTARDTELAGRSLRLEDGIDTCTREVASLRDGLALFRHTEDR